MATGATTTLAGSTPGFSDGVGANAMFFRPSNVAIDPSSTFALVTVLAFPADGLNPTAKPTATLHHWLTQVTWLVKCSL